MKASRFARLSLQAAAFTIVSSFGLVPAQAQKADLLDPVKAYMEFHDQLPTAKTLDQVSKYFCKARWAQMSKDEQNMPKQQFDLTFELFKKLSPEKVSLVSQALVGDVCVLTLKPQDVKGAAVDLEAASAATGESATGTGTVTMRKENGLWKIEMEEWQCSEIIDGRSGLEKGQDTAVTSSSLDAAGGAK